MLADRDSDRSGSATVHAGGSAAFPLFDRAGSDVLFRRPGGAVTAAMFLAAVNAVAAELPDATYMLNLCQDRFHFAVAFVAALLRGQVALLTSDRSTARIHALASRFPGMCSVSDDPGAESPLPHRLIGPEISPVTSDATAPHVPASQAACIVFTSGSTGEPVGTSKSWGELAVRSKAASQCFGLCLSNPATMVGMVPPQHMYGFETTVLLPLHAPVSSWCGAAFYPTDVRHALESVPSPRILVTTPLQIRALLKGEADLPPLARIISATAPLDAGMASEAERLWCTEVHEIYGATEVGSVATRRTTTGDTWTAYPGLRLADAEAGPESGVVVHAPYAEPRELNDIVELHGDTGFRLVGRKADVVKLGGRRASLSGLNRILNDIDGVQDGVFVVPDDLDHRPTARLLAFVVAPACSADHIMSELRGRIDPVFLPRRIVRVDALPRNEVGKLPLRAAMSLRAPADEA